MLKLSLDNKDFFNTSVSLEDKLNILDNAIIIYPFSGLVKTYIKSKKRRVIIVNESCDDTIRNNQTIFSLNQEKLQFTTESFLKKHSKNAISFHLDYERNELIISASPTTSNTVYVGISQSKILIDWDVINLSNTISLDRLDSIRIAQYIEGKEKLDNRTLSKDIYLLVPGTSLRVSSKGISSFKFAEKNKFLPLVCFTISASPGS